MSKMLSFLAAIVVACTVSGVVLADDAQQPAAAAAPAAAATAATVQKSKVSTIVGKVLSVDATASQIVVKGEESKKAEGTAFDVTAKTNIKKAGKDIALSDIVAGDRVIVGFVKNDTKRTALSIKVRPPSKKAAEPAAPATPAAPAAQ